MTQKYQNKVSTKDVLSEYIRKKTRFKPESIAFRNIEETHSLVSLSSRRTHKIQYEIVKKNVTGHLDQNIRRIRPEDFKSYLSKLAEQNIAELPQMAQAWCEVEGRVYEAEPKGQRFLKYRELIGWESNCNKCNGHGKYSCANCSGSGSISCRACSGRGRINCYSCNGRKRLTCYDCNGGYRYVNGQRQRCNTCQGAGERVCYSCEHDGKIKCVQCYQGLITCAPCGGSGLQNCNRCDATGILSELADLDCEVTEQTYISSAHPPDLEVDEFIHKKMDVSLTAKFATMLPSSFSYQDFSILREFNGNMPVGTLKFSLNEKKYLIHDYGLEGAIFDYKNLLNELLGQDLVKLKEASKYSAIYSSSKMASLFIAARNFSSSSLNLEIALAAARMTPVSRDQLKGAMSQESIDDSYKAIDKAFDILLEGCLILPSIPVWIIAIIFTIFANRFDFRLGNLELCIIFIVTTLIGYGLIRAIARYRFIKHVSKDVYLQLATSGRFKVANRLYFTVSLSLLAILYIQDLIPVFI